MIEINEIALTERFMRYVQVDTQSDPNGTAFPTTEKQKDLSRVLVEELRTMGIGDAEMDSYGYVYATIPSNTEKIVPVICFCSHVDTAPDVSGTIKILFTPDEEIGEGTAKLDIEKLGAAFAYTLDGGEAGSLEDETFSADSAKIVIHGVIAHPGYAKNKLVNALKLGGEILHALPKNEWAPEATEKREGFVHPTRFEGIAARAVLEFILRDFDSEQLKKHGERLRKIAEDVISHYLGASLEFTIHEQYRNMKNVLNDYPHVVAYAAEAINRTGLDVTTESIRGGTDGSRLSFMGLPCPNIFTGMQGIHSKQEWISVDDMAKAAETIV